MFCPRLYTFGFLIKNENILDQKTKKKNAERRLRLLPCANWLQKGQTDQWWESLLSDELP